MSKKEEMCTCGCEEYGCVCDGDCECGCEYECDCCSNKKSIALKVGIGIATCLLLGGVIAAIVNTKNKKNCKF